MEWYNILIGLLLFALFWKMVSIHLRLKEIEKGLEKLEKGD